MVYIQGINKDQSSFLPPSLDEYVASDSMVRVIDAFVDGLDILELGFERPQPKHTGRPAYDPRSLLKLYIYGYTNSIRSSRKLAKECTRNIEVMFLLGALTPDFRTISDFRKENPKAIKRVFNAFSKICVKLELFESGFLAIDGTKVRAQNARSKAYNKESLDKKLAGIDRNIKRYLDMLDKSDDDDDEGSSGEISSDKILAAIKDLNERKDTYKGFVKRLKEEDITQILTTDADAYRMHTKDGFNCSYNIHSAVDTKTHIVADFLVSSNPSDAGNLKEVSDKAKEVIEQKAIEVVADKGYDSSSDILACIESGTVAHVAIKYGKDARVFNLAYIDSDITDEMINSTNPSNIKACISAGILPKCYAGKGIDIEIQSRDTLSCFVKHDKDKVICPQGSPLYFTKHRSKKNSDIYKNAKACRECLNRCTDSANAKELSIGQNTNCVPVMVYGSQKYPPQKIPDDANISKNNHNLDRTDFAKKKVKITIPYDKQKLQTRMNTVEHPFGTIKWYDGAHYFLTRGKTKVKAEMALSFLSYNLRRALNIVGFEKLMAALA